MLVDRQIRAIQREEDKVKMELKKAAKQGNRDVCLVFAKEIVNSRKTVLIPVCCIYFLNFYFHLTR